MNSWFQAFRTRVLFAFSTAAVVLAGAALATPARAQGPSPEAAPTLFPGGAYVSYNSIFESRELVPGSVASPTVPTARRRWRTKAFSVSAGVFAAILSLPRRSRSPRGILSHPGQPSAARASVT